VPVAWADHEGQSAVMAYEKWRHPGATIPLATIPEK